MSCALCADRPSSNICCFRRLFTILLIYFQLLSFDLLIRAFKTLISILWQTSETIHQLSRIPILPTSLMASCSPPPPPGCPKRWPEVRNSSKRRSSSLPRSSARPDLSDAPSGTTTAGREKERGEAGRARLVRTCRLIQNTRNCLYFFWGGRVEGGTKFQARVGSHAFHPTLQPVWTDVGHSSQSVLITEVNSTFNTRLLRNFSFFFFFYFKKASGYRKRGHIGRL